MKNRITMRGKAIKHELSVDLSVVSAEQRGRRREKVEKGQKRKKSGIDTGRKAESRAVLSKCRQLQYRSIEAA